MRVIEIVEAGENGRLALAERAAPRPGPGELLVAVAYAGLNHADLLQVDGRYPRRSGVPGLELSGRIAAIGPGVEGFERGQPVCALTKTGAYAEYAVVAAAEAVPLPVGIDLKHAGGLPEALATVWLALFRTAGLKPGERVLIHGGASGIGTAAIQLARLAGAEALATARDPEKTMFCRKLGAFVLDASPESLAERVREATGGEGVDVVLDILGGAYAAEHLSMLRQNGRIVTLALLAGAEATVPLGRLLVRNLSWFGVTLGSRDSAERGAILREALENAGPWIEAGRYRVFVDRTLPLERAAEAHAVMREHLHLGKILLEVAALAEDGPSLIDQDEER